MLPSLLLAATLTAPAAPVPPGALTTPTGLAPVPMFLKADASGHVYVYGTISQMVTVNRTVIVNENGKQVAKVEPAQMMQNLSRRSLLSDMNGTFTTVGGTALTAAEAAQRVKNGSVLLASADGKPIDKGWLRGLPADTIVATADMLKGLKLYHGAANQASTPAPRMVMLATGDDGKVRVEVNATTVNSLNNDAVLGGRVLVNNGAMIQQLPLQPAGAPLTVNNAKKPLENVKFDAYDLTGKRVSREDALKRLKNGGLTLIAGDDRLPDDAYLKAFTGDLLVLVSPELVLPQTPTNTINRVAVVKAAAAVAVPVNPPAAVLPAPAPKAAVAKPAVKVVEKADAKKP